jgi:hypothetical protein
MPFYATNESTMHYYAHQENLCFGHESTSPQSPVVSYVGSTLQIGQKLNSAPVCLTTNVFGIPITIAVFAFLSLEIKSHDGMI